MVMTNNELGEKVARIYRQQFERGEVEGPNTFGPYTARRVWTFDGKEYHAHYAVEGRFRLKTFENFPPFANWLAKEFNLDDRMDRTERLIRISVATLVVVVALGLLVYLLVYAPERSGEIKYLLAAIVGAGASYVFLKKAPKNPE